MPNQRNKTRYRRDIKTKTPASARPIGVSIWLCMKIFGRMIKKKIPKSGIIRPLNTRVIISSGEAASQKISSSPSS